MHVGIVQLVIDRGDALLEIGDRRGRADALTPGVRRQARRSLSSCRDSPSAPAARSPARRRVGRQALRHDKGYDPAGLRCSCGHAAAPRRTSAAAIPPPVYQVDRRLTVGLLTSALGFRLHHANSMPDVARRHRVGQPARPLCNADVFVGSQCRKSSLHPSCSPLISQ